MYIFNRAFEGWTKKPLLGWGTGAYPLVYPPDLNGYWIANLELHILFDTGILGLVLFGIALVAVAWCTLRALRYSAPGWNTTRLLLLGLLLSVAGLFLAYQVTDATWLGFTWALLAMLMMAARFAAPAQTSAAVQNPTGSRVGSNPE
jgi:O-antigen ligase